MESVSQSLADITKTDDQKTGEEIVKVIYLERIDCAIYIFIGIGSCVGRHICNYEQNK
jgi:hypothetical protein